MFDPLHRSRVGYTQCVDPGDCESQLASVHPLSQRRLVLGVAPDDRDPAPLERCGGLVATCKTDDFVTALEQPPDERSSDQAGCTGDKDAAHEGAERSASDERAR